MSFPQPTLAGFIDFIRNVMQINSTVLPDASPTIPFALSVSLATVNTALCGAGYTPGVVGVPAVSIYTFAVYNLAGDRVVNYAPDNGSLSPPDNTYFANLRDTLKINAFISGVIQSAGDESTNESMIVQKAAENFTLGDLQNLKTPWGRTYLALAQDYGEIIGLT